MSLARIIFRAGLFLCLASPAAFAGTELDFWHSYVHAKTSQRHYGFNLADYKRGLFVGPCGLSTKSLQWSFKFDLAGDGPIYPATQLNLSDDNGKAVRVISGQVVTDVKRGRATIALEIESSGATNKFIGNGEYRIRKTK